MKLAEALQRHSEEIVDSSSDADFIVFLCGPNLSHKDSPHAQFRARLRELLEKENFEVVLGEDEGLDNPKIRNFGINAQDNEVEFIRKYCNAVVIIAASVGSWCELGLFSWHFAHKNGLFKNELGTDCIVLIDEKYKGERSYLNEGPATTVAAYGRIEFVDFTKYDGSDVISRLKAQRGISTVDNKRGRPPLPKP